MVVCNRLSDIPDINQSVLTIGSFDGIHCGHLEILKKIKILTSKNNTRSAVITFDPHPKVVLRPDLLSYRHLITTVDKKIEIFASHGVDYLLILPFDGELANIDADTFLEDIIIKYFKPHDIVVGYDHHFGQNRIGGIDLLNSYSVKNKYSVHQINQVAVCGIVVSSSRIRRELASDNIAQANALLGWNYELKGIVEKGDALGRKIGFPTANIKPIKAHQIIPSDGVYSVDILFEGVLFSGMCNIGKRPTVNGLKDRVEVNIFSEENLNLYTKEMTVIFKEYLRKEKRFSSIEKLKLQLDKDKKRCLELNRMIKGVKHVSNKGTC